MERDHQTRVQLNRSHLLMGNDGGDLIIIRLPDGRGVVRAGPDTRGVLGPGALNLPFAIMGRHK